MNPTLSVEPHKRGVVLTWNTDVAKDAMFKCLYIEGSRTADFTKVYQALVEDSWMITAPLYVQPSIPPEKYWRARFHYWSGQHSEWSNVAELQNRESA